MARFGLILDCKRCLGDGRQEMEMEMERRKTFLVAKQISLLKDVEGKSDDISRKCFKPDCTRGRSYSVLRKFWENSK